MNELVPAPVALVNHTTAFDLNTWLASPGRFNPLHIMSGPGSGKSRLVGRGTAYRDFICGIPQIIIDPTFGTINNFIDKLNHIAPDFERRWWAQYHQPLPPAWVHSIEAQLKQLADRLIYVDMSGQAGSPLYYRLAEDESLFDMSQRFLEIIRRLDPALESATVEGWNALYRLGTYVGMILSALDLQITEAEDLIRNPEQWQGRFDQALARYPEVLPAVVFFREFMRKPDLRARRSDSFLTKILAFSADPAMAVMFGTNARSVNAETLIHNKQTALLDYSKIHNADRRRMLMLWGTSEAITYAKFRGTAGRKQPLALVIDEISQILGYQSSGQSIMAADIEELVSVVARNYGLWLTVIHQNLTQLDKRIQAALMQGNQIIGVIPNPEDAELLARYFFQYDPYWVKKKIPVWMGMASEPYYDPVYDGAGIQIDHVSTRTTPTVIDYTTEEFSIPEQLQLLTQTIQSLPRFQFLVRASGIEGQLAAPLQRLDISTLDPARYPDEARVAEACQRLAKRSGLANKAEVLATIKQRIIKPVKKKPVKDTDKSATLNNTNHGTPATANQSAPTVPVLSTPAPGRESRETRDEQVFQ